MAGTYNSLIGSPLTIDEGMKEDNYKGWDFSDIWKINENETSPYLKNMIIPTKVQRANLNGKYHKYDGTGVEGDPYILKNNKDFEEINKIRHSHFKLINNLDLSSYSNWNSIEEFYGVFDGNNKKIINISGTNMGLFSGSRGTIKNLTVEGNVTAANSYAGMITGWNRGLLENVHAKGTLVCANYCGGVTGFSGDSVSVYGTVKDSSSEVDITIPYGSASNVGGLVGYRGAIDNSYYKGTITGTQNTHQYIGGIIGYSPNSLTNSYAEVDINIAGNASKAIGGAIGYSEDANKNTSGNYVKGKVETDGYYVGGFIGELSSGTITKNYSEVDVVGTTSVGGFFGYGRLGTISNNFSTGDVTGSGTYNSVGGFAGHISFGSYGSIWNNYSLSKIIGGHGNTGGFGYGGVTNQGNNYWDIDISQMPTSSIGIGKTTAEMTANPYTDVYSGWDFTNIWERGSDGYPKLRGVGGQ